MQNIVNTAWACAQSRAPQWFPPGRVMSLAKVGLGFHRSFWSVGPCEAGGRSRLVYRDQEFIDSMCAAAAKKIGEFDQVSLVSTSFPGELFAVLSAQEAATSALMLAVPCKGDHDMVLCLYGYQGRSFGPRATALRTASSTLCWA